MNKQNRAEIGSSETTREAFVFNLDQVLPSSTPLTREEMEKRRTLLEWLIGFIEGNGSFALRKFSTLKDPSSLRPCLQINQKEPEALYKIKKALGFGTVASVTERGTGRSYYRYSVYRLCHVKQLIALLNGNLLLHKAKRRFSDWVTAYNRLCDQRAELSLQRSLEGPVERHLLQQDLGEKITLKQSARELDLNSAWLAGFTDAEGGFYASLSANKRYATGFRERLKFYISQKGERQLLQKIDALVQAASVEKLVAKLSPSALKKACLCAASPNAAAGSKIHISPAQSPLAERGLVRVDRTTKPRYCKRCLHAFLCRSSHIGVAKAETYRLELSRLPNLEVLVDYFDRYPLVTKKRLMLTRWKRLVLRGDAIREAALRSQKGMRRYINLYASVGRIRQAYNRDQD